MFSSETKTKLIVILKVYKCITVNLLIENQRQIPPSDFYKSAYDLKMMLE